MILRISASLVASAISRVIRPFSTRIGESEAGSMPLPSSSTVIRIRPSACRAVRRTVAGSGLPSARRSSGDSMPWSRALPDQMAERISDFLEDGSVELGSPCPR